LFGTLLERLIHLRLVNHDLVAIEKPFTAAIRVAIDAHEAAALWHPKHLGYRPYSAQ
jgi:hypothetical protein